MQDSAYILNLKITNQLKTEIEMIEFNFEKYSALEYKIKNKYHYTKK